MPALRHRRNTAPRASNPWGNPGRVDLQLEVPAWTKDALCAEVGVDAFFAEGQGDQLGLLAKQVCAACPVRAQCLEWALTFEPWQDQHGVFGGTGPRERRAIRQERERQEVAA
jgi:WhiB family redox-sensing transcriptional regulator